MPGGICPELAIHRVQAHSFQALMRNKIGHCVLSALELSTAGINVPGRVQLKH